MNNTTLPLKEMSIHEIYNGDKATYEVPIYQRNYAWGKNEISALIQDVYDAFEADRPTYFIGTLVSFHKGDQVYEVIDGQQRLTTIYLILRALNDKDHLKNELTYRARKKSYATLKNIPTFDLDEKDDGIVIGFNYVNVAINEIIQNSAQLDKFSYYFLHNVHLIHYQVPKDIDLNHYFEIMNSRGEQLEKHEIIKARLIETLNSSDKAKFQLLWENCSQMNEYIQQKYKNADAIFGKELIDFKILNFDDLPSVTDNMNKMKINDLIDSTIPKEQPVKDDTNDKFLSIIDFPNFLLIVLKLTLINNSDFNPTNFTLDDKELIHEFDNVKNFNEEFVKQFGYNLLKAKYLLDNYIIHKTNETDKLDSNPWKLQYWKKGDHKSENCKNIADDTNLKKQLEHLLSMFEVTYSPRQRKNYLFYCLMYLFNDNTRNIENYYKFLVQLAEKYLKDIYLNSDSLNENNTPKPGIFDTTILRGNLLDLTVNNNDVDFTKIYGDGTVECNRIPLFIFNYLDYKLWMKYHNELLGKGFKEKSSERNKFFNDLGCSDFGQELFSKFYFSQTRRSLEHFFPQANVSDETKTESWRPNQAQINCFGNFAMIGSDVNSSGSNWSPFVKLSHYLDSSHKINKISVASIKFMIMMQKCKDNNRTHDDQKWIFEDMRTHQGIMENILLDRQTNDATS
jgi:hypothetical protein